MTCLLDTHSLLWCLFPGGRLSQTAKKIVMDTDNGVWVSVVSIWEVALKYALGKIDLKGALPDEFPDSIKKAGFELLALSPQAAAGF